MSETRLFKFLDRGGVGCFSGRVWSLPEGGVPGAWMQTQGAIDPCRQGVHVCRVEDLAHWAAGELYEAEIGGAVCDAPDGVIAERARLVREVGQWPAIAREAVSRSRSRAAALPPSDAVRTYIEELDGFASRQEWPVALYCGAMAFAAHADPSGHDGERTRAAFREERARQSRDIAERC
jgi:hypothetical protein